MRRLAAALLVPLTATVVLSGCGSSPSASANSSVTVSGKTGTTPKVSIPAQSPSGELATKTVVAGHGAVLKPGDSYLANFTLYTWHGKTHRLLFSSFGHTAQVIPVSLALTGLQRAMTGQRVGSRVLAVMPPKYGYGANGNSQLGILPTDTLVWVIEPLAVFGPNVTATGKQISTGGGSLPSVTGTTGAGPAIKLPKTAAPAKLVSATLIKGTGAKIQLGQSVIVKYTGELWRNGQVFDTNWPTTTAPSVLRQFTLSPGSVVPGFVSGLAGATVGSRVLLVIPPALGYGSKGLAAAGIKGTDTLVFVVDIIGVA